MMNKFVKWANNENSTNEEDVNMQGKEVPSDIVVECSPWRATTEPKTYLTFVILLWLLHYTIYKINSQGNEKHLSREF